MIIDPFRFPSGGGPIIPTDVPGLKFWYKADSLSLSDGDPLTTWSDSSPNANTATITIPGQPIYRTNIVNSLPAVEFDASIGGTLSMATPLTSSTHSLFALYKETDLRFIVLGSGLDGGSTLFGSAFSVDVILWRDEADAGITQSSTDPNAFIVLSGVCNAGSAEMWQNKVSMATGTLGSVDYAGIGSRLAAFQRSTGYLVEVFGYDTAVSPTNRVGLENYLGSRGGLF